MGQDTGMKQIHSKSFGSFGRFATIFNSSSPTYTENVLSSVDTFEYNQKLSIYNLIQILIMAKFLLLKIVLHLDVKIKLFINANEHKYVCTNLLRSYLKYRFD